MAAMALARKAGILSAFFIDTEIEFPETVEFIEGQGVEIIRKGGGLLGRGGEGGPACQGPALVLQAPEARTPSGSTSPPSARVSRSRETGGTSHGTGRISRRRARTPQIPSS